VDRSKVRCFQRIVVSVTITRSTPARRSLSTRHHGALHIGVKLFSSNESLHPGKLVEMKEHPLEIDLGDGIVRQKV
jgi:hypothetical protein